MAHSPYEKTGGSKESLTDNSLSTAGWAYLIGDAAYAVAGILSGDKNIISTGAIWWLGGLGAARYGNPSADKQTEILGARIGAYLKEQGVEIPQNPTTELLTKPGGVVQHVEQFLYAHPSEVLNTMYALGAASQMRSGFNDNAFDRKASGALVAAGALTGLLIPEKKPDPANPPKGMVGKAMSWVQEKPLRLSGGFYWLNNLFLVTDAYKEIPKNKASSAFKFVTAGCYIFANAMLAISSKGHGDNQKEGHEAMTRLADVTAQVVAAQPKEVQDALVNRVSGYLAAQPETQMKADDISKLLHTKLERIMCKKDHETTPPQHATEKSWQQRVQPAQTDAPTLSL